MATFCQVFGKRNPGTSAVKTRYRKSENKLNHEVAFHFSHEVLDQTGWRTGELLDLEIEQAPSGSKQLIIKPAKSGRTLHEARFVQFAFDKEWLEDASDFLGFDVTKSHFWEDITIQGGKLILPIRNIDKPVLP